MARILKVIAVYGLCLMVFTSIGFGEELVIGVGNFKPYYIEEDESGIHLDLLKEVFTRLPHYTPQFKFMSNARLIKEIVAGRLDASANVADRPELKPYYLSIPFFRFTNMVLSLKKKNLVIQSIVDLQDKAIATYQGASVRFGEEFQKMAKSNPQYKEYGNQLQTGRLVIAEKVDVRIGDVFIFWHQLQEEYKGELRPHDFAVHDILPRGYAYIVFRDEVLRDEFNKVAEEIMADGTYEAVFEKYMQKLGLTE